MDNYRYYWRALWLPLAAFLTTLIATAIYLEPNSGDLTRMGGYTENGFGWSLPQERFPHRLYTEGTYDRYYDVLVFGDSFSTHHIREQTDPGTYWENFLVQRTGLSVAAIDTRNSDFRDIIEGPIYTSYPPRVVIFENIERDLLDIADYTGLKDHPAPCKPSATPPVGPLVVQPVGIQTKPFDRSAVFQPKSSDFPFLDLDQAANVLKKRLLNGVLGIADDKTLKVQLTRTDLFSNERSDDLLVYRNELRKRNWRDKEIRKAHCRLIALQNLVQANGQTLFLMMIAPDRLTAYAPYLQDRSLAHLSRLDEFQGGGLQTVSVAHVLAQAIANGMRDVYMPNDTHWGVQGHKIAAATVIDAMRQYRIVVDAPRPVSARMSPDPTRADHLRH